MLLSVVVNCCLMFVTGCVLCVLCFVNCVGCMLFVGRLLFVDWLLVACLCGFVFAVCLLLVCRMVVGCVLSGCRLVASVCWLLVARLLLVLFGCVLCVV